MVRDPRKVKRSLLKKGFVEVTKQSIRILYLCIEAKDKIYEQ